MRSERRWKVLFMSGMQALNDVATVGWGREGKGGIMLGTARKGKIVKGRVRQGQG